MRLSNRLLGFLLPSAIPIILYKISPNLLLVDAAYLMLLSIVCVVDYLKTPLFTRVEVSRKMNSKFSLGAKKCRDAARSQPFSLSAKVAAKG